MQLPLPEVWIILWLHVIDSITEKQIQKWRKKCIHSMIIFYTWSARNVCSHISWLPTSTLEKFPKILVLCKEVCSISEKKKKLSNLNILTKFIFNTYMANYEVTRRLNSFLGHQLQVILQCVYLAFLCSYD